MGWKRDLGRGGERKKGEVRGAAGWAGLFCFFSFLFFKSFSNLFKPFFYIFLNQILTQILQLF
jgi:hypothetical protein